MKLTRRFAQLVCIAAVAVMAFSCNNNQQQNAKSTSSMPQAAMEKMTIRFVDEDSIMNNYSLAKDINEAMLRRQNQFDAAQSQKGNEISKFGNAMQQKYQNNGYLTEESFKADQAKLQKMQDDAQSYLGKLQQSIQNELSQSQVQLLDSIDNFMKEYAKQKGYDMQDVIEGLNKRYNKVAKK